MNFWCKLRHRLSIRRPRFPIRVQNLSNFVTISGDFFCILYAECPRYFYFRGRLTYWSRKYTTRVDPHVDNSRQVRSWYDHTLPSYSVFLCRHVTWPCNLDLWSFDLEHMSCMASHVTNTGTKYEDRTPIRSWVLRWLSAKIMQGPELKNVWVSAHARNHVIC